MARPPRTKRRRRALTAGSILLLLLVLAGGFAAYTTYRVNRFAESAFRPEATPVGILLANSLWQRTNAENWSV